MATSQVNIQSYGMSHKNKAQVSDNVFEDLIKKIQTSDLDIRSIQKDMLSDLNACRLVPIEEVDRDYIARQNRVAGHIMQLAYFLPKDDPVYVNQLKLAKGWKDLEQEATELYNLSKIYEGRDSQNEYDSRMTAFNKIIGRAKKNIVAIEKEGLKKVLAFDKGA